MGEADIIYFLGERLDDSGSTAGYGNWQMLECEYQKECWAHAFLHKTANQSA